jgi:hypothetical protein
MGSLIGCQEDFFGRARLETEIHKRDLSLRQIDRTRSHLAARLAECRALQRCIARQRYRSESTAVRSKLGIRRFG